MYALEIIGGVVAALAWVYLLLGRGRFWQVSKLVASRVGADPPGRVAAVVPARNEAGFIEQSVSSLLRQTCAEAVRIFVVDDNSTDGTARQARATAQQAGKPASLTVIQGRALPPGWTGKLWAVQQGIECARAVDPKFFLLTDADVRHAPESISTLAAIAEAGGYDLASFMVKLHCESFAEKLLIPPFVFFFFKLYPPRWVADPRRATAAAAGGCILVRPEALARAGGIEAIRGEIIDDCALARAVKRSGGRVWLGLTDATTSLSAYASFAAIGRMIARTAFNQLRHSTLLLLAALAGLAITYLLPVVLLFTGRALPMVLGAAAWGMMTVAYLPMLRFYRLNPLWAPTLPLAALFYMAATLASAIKYWSARGGEWKGRAQDRSSL